MLQKTRKEDRKRYKERYGRVEMLERICQGLQKKNIKLVSWKCCWNNHLASSLMGVSVDETLLSHTVTSWEVIKSGGEFEILRLKYSSDI